MGSQPTSGPGASSSSSPSPSTVPPMPNQIQPRAFVHVTPSVSRLGGGLFESVRHLSQTIHARSGASLTVLGIRDSRTRLDIRSWAPLDVRTVRPLGPRRFAYAPGLARQLNNCRPDLVHLHGLWRWPAIAVPQWARRARRPYLVSPHGMLEPWALAQASWKKRCALRLYMARCLRNAACLRATSPLEANAIRRAGFANPIALVPNGVLCPPRLPDPSQRP